MAGFDVVDQLNLVPVKDEKPMEEIKLITARVLSKRNHVYEVSGKVPDQPLGMPPPKAGGPFQFPPLPVTRPEEKNLPRLNRRPSLCRRSRKPRRRSLRSRRPKNKSDANFGDYAQFLPELKTRNKMMHKISVAVQWKVVSRLLLGVCGCTTGLDRSGEAVNIKRRTTDKNGSSN